MKFKMKMKFSPKIKFQFKIIFLKNQSPICCQTEAKTDVNKKVAVPLHLHLFRQIKNKLHLKMIVMVLKAPPIK